jgi:hypothetical protein
MVLFGRRAAKVEHGAAVEPGDPGVPPTGAHTAAAPAGRRSIFGNWRNSTSRSEWGAGGGRSIMGPTPGVGEWFRLTALDIFTMFVMGAIGLGVSLHSVNLF